MTYFRIAMFAIAFISTHVLAAECTAFKAMSAEPTELNAKKDTIQRHEWLLLEYLSSEPQKSSRKLFDEEVAKSNKRVQDMMQKMSELTSIIGESQVAPEEGSIECSKIENIKKAVESLVNTREKEVASYHKKFGFLYSCERLSESLLAHNQLINKPDATPRTRSMSKMVLDMSTGPFQMSARVSGTPMEEMTKQAEAFLEITPPQRYAYFAFSCLKRYQKQEQKLKPPAEIETELKACAAKQWIQIGMCVSAAAMPKE